MNATQPGEAAEPVICFRRPELNALFRIYGKMVAAGEWRDYAIDFLRDRAVFSVFRRTSESPLFQIEFKPVLSRRQGAYCLRGSAGQILKRGHDIDGVLRVFEKASLRLVSAD